MFPLLSYLSAGYPALLHLISPFNTKAKAFLATRNGLLEDLKKWRHTNHGHLTWFHCASLGEFEMARPLMELIKNEKKTDLLLVTFFSPSGFEYRKNDPLCDGVFYLPFDGPTNPTKFIEIVQPNLAYFVKYEFWPGYMLALNKANVPVILVNGIFRTSQIFFKWYGTGMKRLLKKFAHLFVQYEPSARLLEKNGITNVTISGDLRFDRVAQMADKAIDYPFIKTFCEKGFTIVGGSTWPVEENILTEIVSHYGRSANKVNVLLVPHDISEGHLRKIERTFTDFHHVRLSAATKTSLAIANVLIVDSIGKLASSYRYADVSLIGGGFTGNLHNILESLVHGVPVFFGPKTDKFPEASYFVQEGVAFPIENTQQLIAQLDKLFTAPEELEKMRVISKAKTSLMKGAARKVFEEIYG